MKRLILTLPIVPINHCRYCLIVLDKNKAGYYFANTIDFSKVKSYTSRLYEKTFNRPWTLFIESIDDLLNHPSVITYTEESNPELFI